MSQTKGPRKWGGDEDQALLDLAQSANGGSVLSWATIAEEMVKKFPGRRLYSVDSCKQHYKTLTTEGNSHFWTNQERQTLLILCEDGDEDEINWPDIAEQMKRIFEDGRKFGSTDLLKKRYKTLKRPEPGAQSPVLRLRNHLKTDPKRRRSEPILEAIRPPIVLSCNDSEYDGNQLSSPSETPVKPDSCKSSSKASDVLTDKLATPPSKKQNLPAVNGTEISHHLDQTLLKVDDFIERHMDAMQKFKHLTESSPDSINDLLRTLLWDPLSEDDCDVIIQWSIASDFANAAKWREYAQRCVPSDRKQWAIVVPQFTLHMIQLIISGRVTVVREKIDSDMDRLRVRIRRQFLRKHSPLYCLVDVDPA